jgi:hypothetical protein
MANNGTTTLSANDDTGLLFSAWWFAGVAMIGLGALTCCALAAGWRRVSTLERRVLVATLVNGSGGPWGSPATIRRGVVVAETAAAVAV